MDRRRRRATRVLWDLVGVPCYSVLCEDSHVATRRAWNTTRHTHRIPALTSASLVLLTQAAARGWTWQLSMSSMLLVTMASPYCQPCHPTTVYAAQKHSHRQGKKACLWKSAGSTRIAVPAVLSQGGGALVGAILEPPFYYYCSTYCGTHLILGGLAGWSDG